MATNIKPATAPPGAMTATASATAGADPAAPPGLKRTKSGGPPTMDEAATKVQAFMKGAIVRANNKDNTLFNAWSQLDWRDESDLIASHKKYVNLVDTHKQNKDATAVPSVPAKPAATPADVKVAAPPTAAAAAAPTTTAPATSVAVKISKPDDSLPLPGPPVLARKESHGKNRSLGFNEKKPGSGGNKKTAAVPEDGADTKTAADAKTAPPAAAAAAAPTTTTTAPVAAAAATPTVAVSDVPETPGPGPWPKVLTLDYVTAMMDWFKNNEILELDAVEKLIGLALPIMKAEPNIRRIPITTKVTVIGDIHGQLDDLFEIFSLNGLPSDRNVYIFNGDFVDRGHNSVECVLTLLAFKVLLPNSFFMNRGNHEARDINSRDGFEKECRRKYNGGVFDTLSAIFAALPMATIIDNRVFVVHGGLFNRPVTLEELDKVDRFHEIPPAMSLLEQMLWNDPDPAPGVSASSRGGNALYFGPDVVDAFLKTNKLERIIRSHECVPQGYEAMFDEKLYTVFSASNYTGSVHNDGAYLVFQKDCVPHPTYYAGPKEGLTNYRMRHALEHDVINRLLQRISDDRLGLIDQFRSVEISKGVITRQQWADGLKKVLKLDIPFLEFQDILGLPKRDVAGGNTGIDYMAFLNRFKPAHSMFKVEAKDEKGLKAQETLEQIMALLSKNRYELESLFRHFDVNGDGEISVSEFREGIASLFNLLKQPFSDATVNMLIDHMDKDHNGSLSYEEFFGSFEVLDPALAAKQRELRKKSSDKRGFIKRQKSTDKVSPRAGAGAAAAANIPPAPVKK